MNNRITESCVVPKDALQIAEVFFVEPLAVTNLDKDWIGGWPDLNWRELKPIADALIDLFARLFAIDQAQVLVRAIEHLDGSLAQAGMRIYVRAMPDNIHNNDLSGALNLFFDSIIERPDRLSAPIVPEIPVSGDARRIVEEIADTVLSKRQGKRIKAPMEVSLDGIRFRIQGRLAARSPSTSTECQYVVNAKIDGYLRHARTCDLLCTADTKYITVAYDIQTFLAELRTKSCDDVTYKMLLRKTQDAKGKSIVTLQRIGPPVPDQPILSH